MQSKFLSILALVSTLCVFLGSCASPTPSQTSSAASQQEASAVTSTLVEQQNPVPEAPQLPVPPPPVTTLPIDKGVDETTIPLADLVVLDKADSVAYQGAPTDGPVYIFLTRHGETIANASSRAVSGQGSLPLTESGREVARYLGLGLQDVYFKSVYSSNLSRTYETASIILSENQTASRNYEINQRSGMREWDAGNFESFLFGELTDMGINLKMAKFTADKSHELDPTGAAESYSQLVNRTWATINEIAQTEAKNGGGNILVVAHSIVNASIARNISYPDSRSTLKNSSVVLLKFENGTIELLSYNDMTYVEKGKAMLETPKPVELNLVVTAETYEDTLKRFNSVLDSDLTGAGTATARALGRQIAPDNFRAVYSSDLWKDINTANLLIQGSGNPYLVVNSSTDLRGVQAGYYEGELLEKIPKAASNTAKDRITAFAENDTKKIAESYETAKAHILPSYQSICNEIYITGGGKIAIVGSELTQQMVIEELLGTPLATPLKPGDVVTLIYDGSVYKLA